MSITMHRKRRTPLRLKPLSAAMPEAVQLLLDNKADPHRNFDGVGYLTAEATALLQT